MLALVPPLVDWFPPAAALVLAGLLVLPAVTFIAPTPVGAQGSGK